MAGSSGQRLSAKVSPATSRRSISVMNVFDNQSGLFSRPSSRLGSQSNVLRVQSRKNSSNQLVQQQACQTSATTDSAGQQQSAPVVFTAAGRRSSLVGMKSMAGYRSQKSSQSDATDQESPRSSGQRRSQPCTPQKSRLATSSSASAGQAQSEPVPYSRSLQQSQSSAVSASPTTGNMSPRLTGSGPDSRRGSGEHPSVQRRGSLVAITLRKLKRTMSISRNDQDGDDGQDGRRQSESSHESVSLSVQEDLAVSRRVSSRTGKLICPSFSS